MGVVEEEVVAIVEMLECSVHLILSITSKDILDRIVTDPLICFVDSEQQEAKEVELLKDQAGGRCFHCGIYERNPMARCKPS